MASSNDGGCGCLILIVVLIFACMGIDGCFLKPSRDQDARIKELERKLNGK